MSKVTSTTESVKLAQDSGTTTSVAAVVVPELKWRWRDTLLKIEKKWIETNDLVLATTQDLADMIAEDVSEDEIKRAEKNLMDWKSKLATMSRSFSDVEELAKKEASNNKLIAERAASGSSSLNVLRPVTPIAVASPIDASTGL